MGTYDIGEFVSYRLEDVASGRFRIVVEGPQRYAELLAKKINSIEISDEDLREWCGDGDRR